jgi:hypothetical protein
MGPMTGRRVGYCAGYDAPGFANPVVPGFANPMPGRGYGMGWGRGWFGGRGYGRGGGGRGWRHRFYATGRPFWAPAWDYGQPVVAYRPTPEQELEGLKHEAEWLKSQLDAISQRIKELEEE